MRVLLFALVVSKFTFADTSAPQLKRVPPKISVSRNYQPTNYKSQPFALGLALGGEGLFGSSTSGNRPTGMGYSAGLLARLEMAKRVKATLIPAFQYLRLSRQVGADSQQLTDPNPANYEQSVRYLSVTGFISFRMNPFEPGLSDPQDPQWWVDAGLQGLFPLSAKQSVSGSETEFTAGKATLILLGSTIDVYMNPDYFLSFTLHAYSSLSGSSASRYYGARFLAAINMRL